jgi:ferric-dicitrate binding protein FerR (iron transport regulator)
VNDRFETLLKLAGERDRPSDEATARARAAARQSWQQSLRARAPAREWRARAWNWPRTWMAAAGIAVLAAVFWPRANAPAEVAQVSAHDGEVTVAGSRASSGSVLRIGEMLATGEGRVALAVGGALSLRVDHRSRLRFEAADRVTLIDGTVYVDSGGLNAHTPLRIETPAGPVRHVGTQFQVTVRATDTRVQVREGRVVFAPSGGAPLDLGAGDLADVRGGRITLKRGQPASGDAWEWAAQIAPAFDIENRPLSEFLAWLAREHGWQIRYEDASLQARVRDIRLHGRLEGLDAAAMIERASLITGVPLSVQDGSLRVGRPP